MSGRSDEPVLDNVLEGLSPAQESAVRKVRGPIKISAGPGSGKTRVLTRRAAYLIAAGHATKSQIMAVTFTNRAAGEMVHRIARLCGGGSYPGFGTFHAVCARWLSDIPEYTVYDEQTQTLVLEEVLEGLRPKRTRVKSKSLLTSISGWKNRMLTPDALEADAVYVSERWKIAVFREYEALLKKNKALDFDDILIRAVTLLRKDNELLSRLQDTYRFVMVDEFQDVNQLQYEIARMVSAPENNLCVVGDEDQSIYSFRGAARCLWAQFDVDFPESERVVLDENFRSTKTIVAAANSVIWHNHKRDAMKVRTTRPEGRKLSLFMAASSNNEASHLASLIKSWMHGEDSPFLPSDIAILYRTHAQASRLCGALDAAGLPHHVFNSLGDHDPAQTRFLALFKFLSNPHDSFSFQQLIWAHPDTKQNNPTTLSKKDLLRLRTWVSGDSSRTTLAGLQVPEEVGFSTPGVSFAIEVAAWLVPLKRSFDCTKSPDLTWLRERILYYHAKVSEIAPSSLLAEVVTLNDALPEGGKAPKELLLDSFLHIEPSTSEAISLMTVHASKGLEFPLVILPGLEDGLFPLRWTFTDDDEVEEERRLFYVALTRAKESLVLSYSAVREFDPEEVRANSVSRFVKEIPPDLVSKSSHFQTGLEPCLSLCPLAIGGRVQHKIFGGGTVIALSKDRKIVTVDFDRSGTRTLRSSFLR